MKKNTILMCLAIVFRMEYLMWWDTDKCQTSKRLCFIYLVADKLCITSKYVQ